MKSLGVLNLVISGIPSILMKNKNLEVARLSFKPCYKWNTFNTLYQRNKSLGSLVLNLVISGIPSILSVVVEFVNGVREF